MIARKNMLAGTAALLAFLGAVPCRVAAADPEYTLRLAIIAMEESHWGDFVRKAKGYIETRTRGRVKMIWYMSDVMGDEPQLVKRMKRGDLQGAALSMVGLGTVQPAFRALVLPFLFKNYREVDYILDSLYPKFDRLVDEKGFVLMGFSEVGFAYYFTQQQIHSIQDIENLNTWIWDEGEVFAEDFMREIGFRNPVLTSLFDLKPALTEGRINAYYSPCYAQLPLQWYDHAQYKSEFAFFYTPGAFIIDKKYWQSLPPDLRNIIRQAMDFLLKPLREVIRKEEEQACRGLLKRGIQEWKYPKDVIDELERRSRQAYFKFADKKYPRDLIEEILQKLSEHRSR